VDEAHAGTVLRTDRVLVCGGVIAGLRHLQMWDICWVLHDAAGALVCHVALPSVSALFCDALARGVTPLNSDASIGNGPGVE
jgi:hypothetical protein